ncbi:MAG: protein kinase [Ruminiclostridium sp.]|nr:protein kinase [Ruminiclostridium sp.]MBQ9933684.1 protein kinase [Ruminiclostridium sp.]
MSIDSRIRSYESVFQDWKVKEYLGGGSGGQTGVYRIVRPHGSWEEVGALKVITIVEAKGKFQEQSESFQHDYLRHREQLRAKAEQEVQLMYRLRDCAQVVNYQDYTFINWQGENNFGCDMLIRMEYLTSLETILMRQTVHEAGILRVGRDMTEALIRCHQEGIIHRDIKPANIFMTPNGNYKLGDFGIARILDDTQFAYTSIGTRAYAAPEQTRQETYDHRVDIYSLGLTLYEMSNLGKLPYAESGYVRHDEVLRRLTGDPLPAPSQASPALANVILKACSFLPEDRYPDARAFQRALEMVGQKEILRKDNPPEQKAETAEDPYATALAMAGKSEAMKEKAAASGKEVSGNNQAEQQKKAKPASGKGRLGILYALLAVALIGLCGAVFLLFGNQDSQNYAYHIEDCTWEEAAQRAQNMGGKLVTIDSKKEMKAILRELDDLGYQDIVFFVGGKRALDATDYFWINEFQEPEGEPLNGRDDWMADLWSEGEPSLEYKGNQEPCLTLECKDGKWGMNDVSNELLVQAARLTGSMGYIVEFEE